MEKEILTCTRCNKKVYTETDNKGKFYCENCGPRTKNQVKMTKQTTIIQKNKKFSMVIPDQQAVIGQITSEGGKLKFNIPKNAYFFFHGQKAILRPWNYNEKRTEGIKE